MHVVSFPAIHSIARESGNETTLCVQFYWEKRLLSSSKMAFSGIPDPSKHTARFLQSGKAVISYIGLSD